MNLFGRSKSILSSMQKASSNAASKLQQNNGDSYVEEFLFSVPLTVSRANDWEPTERETDIEVERPEDGPVDLDDVREGMEHFFGSLMNFAFAPLRDGEPTIAEEDLKVAVAPSDAEDAKKGDIMLVVQHMQLADVPFSKAALEIDRYERLMFGEGWEPYTDAMTGISNDDLLTKRFASELERRQVENLFCCMAQVFGVEDQVSAHFVEADDERDIVVDKDFLKLLATREQSMEAVFDDDDKGYERL